MANTTVIVNPTGTTPISEQEAAQCGFNLRYKILSSDLIVGAGSGASDTVTVTLGPTPANYYIDKCLARVVTAFAGITAMTVTVGTTSSVAAAIASTSVLTAAVLPQVSTVPILTNLTATATVGLVAVFTAAGTGGPAALTAGEFRIYLNLKDATKLP